MMGLASVVTSYGIIVEFSPSAPGYGSLVSVEAPGVGVSLGSGVSVGSGGMVSVGGGGRVSVAVGVKVAVGSGVHVMNVVAVGARVGSSVGGAGVLLGDGSKDGSRVNVAVAVQVSEGGGVLVGIAD
jgi:hypothetical protein